MAKRWMKGKKLIAVIVASLVIIGLLSLVAWFVIVRPNGSQKETEVKLTVDNVSQYAGAELPKLTDETKTSDLDTTESVEVFDKAIAEATDDKTKGEIYLKKSRFLVAWGGEKARAQATAAAYKAEEYAPSAQTALQISLLETANSNQEKSSQFHTLYLERSKSEGEVPE